MKVIILAGGLGSRISEYAKSIPKPMILINKIPILIHIMKHFSKFEFNEFIIATGYKGNIIKKMNRNEVGNIEFEVPLIKSNKIKNDLMFFILLIKYLLVFLFYRKQNAKK